MRRLGSTAGGGGAPSPIFVNLGQRTPWLAFAVLAVTAVLAVPFLLLAPDDFASTEPGGAVFDARDRVDERFVASVFDTPFLGETADGDVLRAEPLRALLLAQDALRADPDVGPTLYAWYVPEAEVRATGVFSLADFVDLELRSMGVEGGLLTATDAQVKEAGAALIARHGVDSLVLGLSQQTSLDDRGRWTVPGLALRVLSDDDVLGFGNRSINLGADTAPEQYSRDLQTILRQAEGWEIYGVGIDVNLTSQEQGALAGPFIGLTVLVALLMLGIVFRSYWVVAVVSSIFLVLLIWLKGLSNLIGLQESTALSLIVPIAMISFGVDYAFHSIGRYREERTAGRPAAQAAMVGTAAVSGALMLAAVSDSAAFLANVTAGIASVVQFGIGAAIALVAAWLLLGIVTPYLVAWIEERVPEPGPGRWSTAGRCAGSLGAVLLATASVLLIVFVLPWAGVLLSAFTVLVTLVLPVLAQQARPGPRVGDQPASTPALRLAPALGAVVVRLTEWRVAVTGVALLATVVSVFFAVQVPTRFDVKDLFSADSDFVVALDMQDEHVGSLRGEVATIYIEGDLTDPVRLGQLRTRLDQLRASDATNLSRDADGVRLFGYGVLEVIDAAWASPSMRTLVRQQTGIALTDADGDGIPDTSEQIRNLLEVAAERGVPLGTDGTNRLAMTPDEVAVRVDLSETPHATTVIVGIAQSRDQQVIEQVRRDLSPITTAISEDFGGSFVQLTGSPVARAASLDATARALLISLPVALLACFAVAALFLRSVRFALVSIVPITMVVAGLYAFMERFGFAINLVTATIGAISIGIGVDFALHYSSRFRQELASSGRREDAVRAAAEGTGVALVASTMSSAAGFAILGLAPMPLFATYGLLTVVMVVGALAVTLTVLPSLLVLVTADASDPVVAASAAPPPEPKANGVAIPVRRRAALVASAFPDESAMAVKIASAVEVSDRLMNECSAALRVLDMASNPLDLCDGLEIMSPAIRQLHDISVWADESQEWAGVVLAPRATTLEQQAVLVRTLAGIDAVRVRTDGYIQSLRSLTNGEVAPTEQVVARLDGVRST